MIDTGDQVRNKLTGDKWLVCCVHPPIVYLNCSGNPAVRMDDVELIKSATDTERHSLLKVLADSSGTGHRPACARQRLRGSDA